MLATLNQHLVVRDYGRKTVMPRNVLPSQEFYGEHERKKYFQIYTGLETVLLYNPYKEHMQ